MVVDVYSGCGVMPTSVVAVLIYARVPMDVYHSQYPYPSAVGARALPVVLCSLSVRKAKIRIEQKSGRSNDDLGDRGGRGEYATTITPKRWKKNIVIILFYIKYNIAYIRGIV